MHNQKKMGFWTVTSLVAGSQIGTGIFLLSANMAAFGAIGLCSWLITATGAILLALVFGQLSQAIPKTGGPHAFIEHAFGKTFGFFSAWTYWVISWLSTPIVVISVVSYLMPLIGELNPLASLLLQILILAAMTALNLSGVRSAGNIEFVFTVIKLIPLILVPLAGLYLFNTSYFVPFNPTPDSPISVINAAALLTLWGFIGVESATTPAGSVNNPKKTIPRAIITGTLLVALVYIFSNVVIMGVVPPSILEQSKAPFADAAQIIFGGNWHLAISVAASLVCLGTLNAWILTSGQIALGAAYDGHFPEIFTYKNSREAPLWGLILSATGMIPVLMLSLNHTFMEQVVLIVDVCVTAFLFVYVASVLSYLKLFCKTPNNTFNLKSVLIGIGALIFCVWALYSSGIKMLVSASLITLAGVPMYVWRRKNKLKVNANSNDPANCENHCQ